MLPTPMWPILTPSLVVPTYAERQLARQVDPVDDVAFGSTLVTLQCHGMETRPPDRDPQVYRCLRLYIQ